MVKKLLYFSLILLLISCSNLKNTHQQLASGNYDVAINKSIEYLRKNRFGKKAADYHQILFESFTKAVAKDERTLSFLKSDPNPESLERIFETYLFLEKRQNKIRPLLPINGYSFKMKDYTLETINTKTKLSDYLYNKGNKQLKSKDKHFIRQAHEDFKYLQSINPNYKDVVDLIQESHLKGTEYVFIQLKNKTQFVIPKRLQKELLDIRQYNLDNYWVEYHTTPDASKNYDYNIQLYFNDIQISPEQVKELHILKEKLIKDGQKYVLDKNGNVKKDKNGNDIKEDNFRKVKSNFHQFTQFKECSIFANAAIIDNKTNKTVTTIPFRSQFAFEHIYATQTGDRRALARQLLDLLQYKQVPFPSNNQLILDAGNDIKYQLKKELKALNF